MKNRRYAGIMSSASFIWLAMDTTAQAQSSVTMYGRVDDSLNWTSNAGGYNQ
jgi:hypothetical protein